MSNQPHAENLNERDVLGGEPETMVLEMASVGWEDATDWYDQGGSSNDGTTFVRAQLYRGRTPGAPIKAGVAQGHKVLVQISGPLWRIPRLGERCIIGFPGGFSTTPGAGVILGWLGASPPNQFSPTKAKIDLGSDYDFVLKAKSITLSDYNNRFIAIGPQSGVTIQDKDGTGAIINNGAIAIFVASGGSMTTILQLTASDINAIVNGGSMLQLTSTKATMYGVSCYVQGGGVYLGKVPTATTFAGYGSAPGSPPTTVSTSVFISP